LLPFGTVAMFLDEVLPTTTQTHASTIRNYTQPVGQRLARHQDTLPTAIPRAPAGDVVLGLDGGYVSGRAASRTGSYAFDVNDKGQIAGSSDTSNAAVHAVLWQIN
jgi:probable HAF family extracellular repeat protein